jgi:hypothetical protein
MSTCKVCDYSSEEVLIVNDLCSVHTVRSLQDEGYATALVGRILCDDCHLDEVIKEQEFAVPQHAGTVSDLSTNATMEGATDENLMRKT